MADLLAGLLVGVVAVPLAIAFAIASGAPPIAGLVTGVVAGAMISMFGGSRFQIGGPTGAFVGLCAAIAHTHGFGGLALASVMGGVLLIALGAFRLGAVVRFIPTPVVVGFTSGIAAIIASTQLRDAFGISQWPAEAPAHVHDRLIAVWDGMGSWNPWAPILAVSVVAIILVFRCYLPRWPGALIAIVGVSGVAIGAGIPVETIAERYGALPMGFPAPSLDVFVDLEIHGFGDLMTKMRELSGAALAVGLLAAIESLLSATVADHMGGDRHDSDMELMAQGAANIAAPLFGGLPATGAIARTATNIRAGARSPVAGLVHAAVLLMVAIAAGPLVQRIPLCALAGVLVVVAWYMSELGRWPRIMRGGRSDALLLPLAFLLTVFVDLAVAVEVGVVLGMFFFVRRMSLSTQARSWCPSELAADAVDPADIPDTVEIIEINGPFFFGIAAELRELIEALEPHHRYAVLRMRSVPFIDATAAASLDDLVRDCRKQGAEVFICGAGEQCAQDLDRHGVTERVGQAHVLPDLPAVLVAIAAAEAAA
ncbi:MAG: SulP family inorganic anion transporter [Planctomycetota bacterium]|nr:SulP family inorganic anion transporter [Planctomycetota bacterium]